MMYFLGHWKTGFAGGLRMGLGLGVFCVGCCWGFMALGLCWWGDEPCLDGVSYAVYGFGKTAPDWALSDETDGCAVDCSGPRGWHHGTLT